MSNLVEHAKRELSMIREDPETTEGYLKVIQAFADMGHSGGSASVAIPVINALLQMENLTPLTDNPEEWMFHGEDVWGADGGIWQNKRNGEAFSNDGGKTYYLLSDNPGLDGQRRLHNSHSYTRLREVQASHDN